MIKPLRRDSNTMTIATFWEGYELEKYDFSPPYQRASIWSQEKQEFLIDSLLRNFPIPPIFLHQKIDAATGRTKYDLIDGKQRLTSIVRFLKDEIPVSSEFDTEEESEPKIAGKYFSELGTPEFEEIKKAFWSYKIPIEYIDTSEKFLIDNIFDRLNRNGETLTGQELRNAQYHDSKLVAASIELSNMPFWKNLLSKVDKNRMEDIEFMSELLFVILEGGPQEASNTVIDEFYAKYLNQRAALSTALTTSKAAMEWIGKLNLEFTKYKIDSVSHLYGIWCLALEGLKKGEKPETLASKLNSFYEELRSRKINNMTVLQYKDSMSSRTKSKNQRIKRLEALLKYCGI